MAASSRRHPARKRSEFAYSTPSYFEERQKQLEARQRAQLLSARHGSKKAAQAARKTGRLIAATKERADFARRTQQRIRAAGEVEGRAERKRQRLYVRSFNRLPPAERQRVKALLAEFGNRPVPRNVDTGLSQTALWLFFQAGGQTG
jgi:hypothetical protein